MAFFPSIPWRRIPISQPPPPRAGGAFAVMTLDRKCDECDRTDGEMFWRSYPERTGIRLVRTCKDCTPAADIKEAR